MALKRIKSVPYGIIVNPKLGTLTYCGTRPAYSGPGALSVISLFLLNGQEIATGYFDEGEFPASYLITGYPRVHTTPGVFDRRMRSLGYGSPLYYALALASEMHRIKRLDMPKAAGRMGAGISSTSADSREEPANDWWDRAVDRFGLAKRGVGCVRHEVNLLSARDASAAEREAAKNAALELGIAEYGKAEVSLYGSPGSYEAVVKLCGIPFETMAYSAVDKYVAVKIIPEKKIDNKKTFEGLADVPKPWFKANKEVLLCANVGELQQLLGNEALPVMVRLIEALEAAKATTAEVEEFTTRFERGIDAWCKPQKSAAGVRMPSGAIRPSATTFDVLCYRNRGAIEPLDHTLAYNVAQRRMRCGWDSYW